MRLLTAFLFAAAIVVLPAAAFAQYDIRIGNAATNGGSWSGGNPDLWTSDGVYNTDRTINKDEIVSRLNAGTSVTIVASNGSITDSAGIAITKTSGGDATLTLKAVTTTANSSNITFSDNDTIASTSGKLTIIINSDGDANGEGYIHTSSVVNSHCYFKSNGGDIVLGGGADPRTTPACGQLYNGGGDKGIYLQGVTMLAATGAISLRGQGTIYWHGVELGSASKLETTSGAITVWGAGGNSGSGIGVYITGDNTTIGTEAGAITVTGTGGLGATTSGIGIYMMDASAITSVDGPITITGTGRNGVGAGASGVWITGKDRNDPLIATVDGTITIDATAGSSSGTTSNSMYGLYMDNGARISAMGSGSIDIAASSAAGANQMNNYGLSLTNSQATPTLIETNSGAITVRAIAGAGATGNNSGLYMYCGDSSPGAYIASTSGTISVYATSANGGHGIMMWGAGAHIESSGDVAVKADASGGSTTGNGMYLVFNAYIKTTGMGNLAVNATAASVGNYCTGISFGSGAPGFETEMGDLNVSATGGGNSGNSHNGISLGGSRLYSRSGRVAVNATAGFAGVGLYMETGATVKSDSGNLVITAQGSGSDNYNGIYMTGSNVLASTYGDTCLISATGSGTGAGLNGYSSTIGAATFAGEMVIEGGSPASDQINISNFLIRGSGALTLRPKQASSTIGVAGASGDFNLSTWDLNAIQTGFTKMTIGRSDETGAMTIGARTFSVPLTLTSGTGAIAITGALSVGTNTLEIVSGGAVSQTAAVTAENLRLGGTGMIDLSTQNNVIGTLYANVAGVKLRDDAGITVGQMNAVEAWLSTIYPFIETADFSVARLTLAGRAMYEFSDTLQKLTVSEMASVAMLGNCTVDTLVMNGGNITTYSHRLSLGSNPSSAVSVSRTSGSVVGTVKRWFGASTVTDALIPVGTIADYHGASISYTSAPSGGAITAQFITTAPGTTGLPLTDADGNIVAASLPNGYWQFTAGDGLSGGTYTLDLAASGFPGIADYQKVKILKRANGSSAWTYDGTHSAGTGSNALPVAHRTGMSGFGEFTVAQAASPAPIFSCTPASVEFNAVAVNTPKVDSVKIKNTGTKELTITSVASDNACFTTAQGDTVVAMGDSVVYSITFNADAMEYKGGSITFTHDGAGSPFTLDVYGQGVEAEPTLQASDISFTRVGAHSMTVHWMPGNGARHMVLVKAGSAVDANPVDGTMYWGVSSTIGSGEQIGSGNYIVYASSDDSVEVTGLTPSTTYHVAVFDYNGNVGTENYRTASPPIGMKTTSAVVFDSTAGFALQFDGMDDGGIDAPASIAMQQMQGTVEAWVKIPVSGAGSGYRGIISKYSHYGIFLKDNVLIAYDWSTAEETWDEASGDRSTGIALNDNQWHHIALTFTDDPIWGNGLITIYLDGVKTAVDGGLMKYVATTYGLNIGYGYAYVNGGVMIGQLDEVKIWNTVRTVDEIRSDMHRTLTGAPSGLATVYQFKEGSGSVVSDIFGANDGQSFKSLVWVVSTAPVGKGTSTAISGIVSGSASLGSVALAMSDEFGSAVDLVSTAIMTPPNVLPSGSLRTLNDRYWIVSAYGDPGTYAAQLTLGVPSAFTNYGAAAASDYTLYRRSANGDGAWSVVGAASSLTDTSLTFNNVTSFGQFAIGTNDPMPVELASFKADASGARVSLQWSTATEVNTHGFEIEKRRIAQAGGQALGQWQKIGFVAGAGTSNAPKTYGYTDAALQAGTVIYRLKQIDRDGKFSYSQTVEATIEPPKEFALFQNFPNPFNPTTIIRYQLPHAEKVRLVVYDLLGKEVAVLADEVKEAGSYEIPFDASRLSAGVYFFRVSAGSFTSLKKMLLLK